MIVFRLETGQQPNIISIFWRSKHVVAMPVSTMVHRWHTTTTLTKCVVVWCCGCCFEYPQQHILTKCVVVWCCGCCFEYPQQHILTKCVVVWHSVEYRLRGNTLYINIPLVPQGLSKMWRSRLSGDSRVVCSRAYDALLSGACLINQLAHSSWREYM